MNTVFALTAFAYGPLDFIAIGACLGFGACIGYGAYRACGAALRWLGRKIQR